MIALFQKFAHNVFRVSFHKVSNMRPISKKSNPKAAIMVLILLFVIIYYGGVRLHSSFKSNMDYSDGHSLLLSNKSHQFLDPLRFLVRDSVCEIPRIHSHSPELEDAHISQVICSTELQRTKPLVSKLLDRKTDRYYLHINEQWKPLYLQQRAEVTCCFREFQREDDCEITDFETRGTACYVFKQDFVVPLDVNGIIVNCMRRGSKKLIFVDAFFFIHKRNQSANIGIRKIFGVLLLGIDSMSQINFRRRMKRTNKYLMSHKSDWHAMQGFNKLGYDALANLMSILTGLNLTQAHSLCDPRRQDASDTCPLLWKQVSAMGMPTAFAEDRTDMRTLSIEALHHKQAPTDYYLRPFMSAIERRLRVNTSLLIPKYCLGPRFSANYVFDYALEFAQRFAGSGGLGLFWVNSFRDHYVEATVFDYEFSKYLELLKTTSILNNYVVILLSGNGMLRGRLNKLKSGFYEERLPFLYISLPTAWEQQHPELVNALRANRNRLISPLDLHLTVKHALALGAGGEPHFSAAAGCESCQSILKPIAANRSCSDAGIDWMWCSCEPFVAKWCNSYATSLLMNSLLAHMNELLLRADMLNGTCQPLSLQTLYGIYNSQLDGDYYYVKFSTVIANAEFEVALWYNSDKLAVLLDKNKLNRLDRDAVGCVRQQNELLRKLCVCVQKAVSSSSKKEVEFAEHL